MAVPKYTFISDTMIRGTSSTPSARAKTLSHRALLESYDPSKHNITVTSDTTMVPDYGIYIADSESNTIRLTLPKAADCGKGFQFVIKTLANAAVYNVTCAAFSGETIDGGSTTVLDSAYSAIIVWCDGTQWFVY